MANNTQDAVGDDAAFVSEVDEKKNWEEMVMKAHPHILKMAEETRALSGLKENWQNKTSTAYKTPSYGRNLSEAKMINPDILTEPDVVLLIAQYLKEQKMMDSYSSLIEEVLQKHPEYKIRNTDIADYTIDPTFAGALDPLVRLGLPDSDNIFAKMPFEEEDFPTLPKEEYDQHIKYKADKEDTTPITEEKIVQNENCEVVLEKAEGSDVSVEIPAVMTINQLIKYLYLGSDIYMKKFFEVFREFVQPNDLLGKVLQLAKDDVERFKVIMNFWLDTHHQDFTQAMITQLVDSESGNGFTEDYVKGKMGKPAIGFEKFNIILKDHSTMEQYFPVITTEDQAPVDAKIPKNILTNQLYLKDIEPNLIAEAICLIDEQMYKTISMSELCSGSGPNISNALRAYHIAIEWVRQSLFNERILPDPDEPKKYGTQNVKEKFLKVWEKVNELGDCHALAVFCTVFNSAEHKKSLLARENRTALTKMLNYFDSKTSYSSYRKGIAEHIKDNKAFVPFLGITLHDIITTKCGLETTMPDGKINFLKFNSIYNCSEYFCLFKKIKFPITPLYQVISLVLRGMSEVEYMVNAN
ncbi:hypothetical protein EIN_084200 [Entamoeba invadens IP1]|uniref:hypothetical protein n=1 Tax=Entamoeba invadens IP1 TaxID=370355 RepID=UPI0002C3D49C|nr:hypothetical protein EIN_084200 [Entamoeba invadens IP1]ELP85258.1 hypothetical protein EIN_084200 [Entamoeba invadens IP1]|eukprot:XP_004184604.1 hypothetical protein EIN_084200 [Entamoeba invadens IP1]